METSVLHAYLDGALASQEHEEIQQAIQRDEALRQQRDEVEAQRDFVEDRLALLTQEDIPLPSTQRQLTRLYDALATEEHTPTKPTASTTQSFQSWGGWGLAAMMGVLLMFSIGPKWLTFDRHPNKIAKSGLKPEVVSFRMYYNRPGDEPSQNKTRNVREVKADVSLHEGDLVQFRYKLSQPAYGMIVSINQRGEAFSFVPFQGKKSVYLDKTEGYLPGNSSLELDDYVGAERFFMVLSSKPFTYRTLAQQIKRCWRQAGRDVRQCQTLSRRWSFETLLIKKTKKTQP